MYIVYIDDSYSKGVYCFSGIVVHSDHWKEVFRNVKAWRKALKQSDGVPLYRELHATDLVSGRGRISSRIITKWRRCQIYREGLQVLSAQRGVRIFNVCNSHSMLEAFERLLNRINTTMEKSAHDRALLICDEARKMAIHKLHTESLWTLAGR